MGKKKKEKVTYVDDGRTIANMSGIDAPRLSRSAFSPGSTAKEKWDTYWNAVKMMFGPMMITITALGVIYLIMWFIFWLL